MASNLPTSIKNQIPEYVVESYPIFVDFLETYYRYAYDRTVGVGAIQNHAKDVDIDRTLDDYIDHFYKTYGSVLPREIAADKRNFVKILNDIYAAKGTEQALKLLFQGVFGERISVSYPSDSILRASDGKWIQERYFTVSTKYGTLPDTPFELTFGNTSGNFKIQINTVDNTDPSSARLIFDTKAPVYTSKGQEFTVYNSNGTVRWVGNLLTVPGKLDVSYPGKNWQVGQVITVPGTYKNTVAKVTKIDDNGGIVRVEILEHGFGHTINQSTVVSPYNNVPPSSAVQITTTATSSTTKHYDIAVKDYTFGIDELTTVSKNGSPVVSVTTNLSSGAGNTAIQFGQSALTFEEWLASRAILSYTAADVVNMKGYYLNSDGQISNQEIKMQDNFFYQAFSYVIETTKDIGQYRSMMNAVHPAGTKRFINLLKSLAYDFVFEASRTMSLDTLYLSDFVTTVESALAKDIGKAISDTASLTEVIGLTLNKSISDSVFSVSLDNAALTVSMYADETYFAENYSVRDLTLTIG